MNAGQVIVSLGGLLAIAGVVWFFWGPRADGVKAALTPSARQEAMIAVKGGYTPDIIVVEHVKPMRLSFPAR